MKAPEAKAPEAAKPTPAAKPPKRASNEIMPWKFPVTVDRSRDALLTDFGKETLDDRYLLPGESYQDLFARVAAAYADDAEHAQRLYDYISQLWFMPATPVLSNGGTDRGLPISCFLNSVSDSLDGIVNTWNENVWLASRGGGIGTYWGRVRGIGEPVGLNGKTSGIIPFVRVMDSLTLAISQGSLRRGSAAVYLDVTPPGDRGVPRNPQTLGRLQPQGAEPAPRRPRSPTPSWRRCATAPSSTCVSPKTGEKRAPGRRPQRCSPKLVETRLATGEPYIIFVDTVNRTMPKHQRDLGLKVSTSNLCSRDHAADRHGPSRQGSHRGLLPVVAQPRNLGRVERPTRSFIEDVHALPRQRPAGLSSTAPNPKWRAPNTPPIRERSVGLGVMGFHTFLQARGIAFEGAMAKSWNMKIFKHIRAPGRCRPRWRSPPSAAPCPDAADMGVMERFSYKMAIAPTAVDLDHRGGTSACIEPIPANIYTHKTLSGSFVVKNPYPRKAARSPKSKNSDSVWNSILERGGSVQHLDFLTPEEKAVFSTAFEIDQRWLLELAADRTPYIDQAQSLNLFIPADVDKWDLLMLHYRAWELGIKSLYYLPLQVDPARRLRRRRRGRQHRRSAGDEDGNEGL